MFAAAIFLQSPAPAMPGASSSKGENIDFDRDTTQRMTVPVTINGGGPYNFIVDTGAERTVISEELAQRLRLSEGRSARVHSITEVQSVGTVIIPDLTVSRNTVRAINAPALARRDLGADGMLGVDSLKSQRVLFDFERDTMWVSPSSSRPEVRMENDTIIVRARSKFGHLILADAHVDGQKVFVIIDTGSQVSIGNEALRRKLAKHRKLRWLDRVEVVSVTGGKLTADYAQVNELRVGGVELRNMPIAFADAYPFRKLDLISRPALLLGMDSLAMFDRVSIDFANRSVKFDMPDFSARRPDTRLASLEPASRSAAR
ncbi:MAG TPA: retroviral-like aspartic protease family protein [Allosphingosinicella sp.]|uniref:retroviral-like aspartic protease family protein n=1 Tax=Allosphingosinicella sp. TaxID=2823234 RepID=UPI002ED89876